MSHALSVLGWLEMTEDDQPPEEIWLDPEAIAAHFETVREKYEQKAQGVEVPEGDLADNEITRGLRR